MNAPPLIRSARRALQTPITSRCAWQQVLRAAQQSPARSPLRAFSTGNRSRQGLSPESTSLEPADNADAPVDPRLPRTVQTLHLKPLRREAEYGVPSADLQMRSYSKRSLEFFADFALRAAYTLGLPAFGPVPLPHITERWTVPKSHFVHKKSQQNFERITVRRLIQIRDGHPETVQLWLAYLQKHAYPGVGMKASVWEYEKLDVAKSMDEVAATTEELMASKWQHLSEGKVNLKTFWEDRNAAKKAGEPTEEEVAQVLEKITAARIKASSGL